VSDDGAVYRYETPAQKHTADNLSPQKAAILLRLALTTDADAESIAQMYPETARSPA